MCIFSQKTKSIIFLAMILIFFLATCKVPFHEDLYSLIIKKAHFTPIVNIQPRAAPYYQFNVTPVPTVTITCIQPDAHIFYSFDDSRTYTPYSAPFTLPLPVLWTTDTNITITTFATHPDFEDSPVTSETYPFLASGSIVTIAGMGSPGFSGDGNFAYMASLNSPKGLTLDAAGNIFIADTGNHRIRKIDILTGIISTIAGTGTAGFAGDGGLATAAQLSSPSGVCVDNTNIYIADTGNNRIRSIDLFSLNITTYAGTGTAGFSGDNGTAIAAQLNSPTGISFDNNNKNLVIADTGNHCIRMILLTTTVITTVAGTGGSGGFSGDGGLATAATLSSPTGASIKLANKDLYIADTGNNRVRFVNGTTGTISTFAGTGIAGYSGDGGLATMAEVSSPAKVFLGTAGKLFVSDSGNNCIRLISGVTISTIPNTGPNQLNNPTGIYETVTLPYAGTYIADTGNNRIRKILQY